MKASERMRSYPAMTHEYRKYLFIMTDESSLCLCYDIREESKFYDYYDFRRQYVKRRLYQSE